MARTKIKWNLGAFQQIRRLETVDAMLRDVVSGIEAEVNDVEGYKSAVTRGRTRNRGAVWTAEAEAIADNEENQSLLRALANARVGL